MKATTKERFGVENVFEDTQKIQQAVFEKYGVTNIMRTSVGKERLIQSNLEKYGVPCNLQIKEVRDQIDKKNLEKYGNKCSLHGPYISEKVAKDKKQKYWEKLIKDPRFDKVLFKFSIDGYRGLLEDTRPIRYPFECRECHTEFEDYISWNRLITCPKCNPVISQGVLEKELFDWISSIIPNVVRNTRRLIPPLEIDIYLPDYKLAIEFNEVYWHSEISSGRDHKYHLNKTKECAKLGIILIHIFDSEWVQKKEVVQSIILSKLGKYEKKVGARECKRQRSCGY